MGEHDSTTLRIPGEEKVLWWRRLPILRRFVSAPRIEIAPGDVVDFWAYMARRYGTRAVRKSDAAEMKAIGRLLDLLGVIDRQTFLDRFTTTIGTTIYTPFEIGRAEGGWDLWHQILICVHEHQHVVQDDKGLKYEWDYITSPAKRTTYEIEAYRTGFELEWKYYRRTPDPAATAALLRNYGCGSTDVEVARKALALTLPTIKAGAITTPTVMAAVGWLDERIVKR